MYCTIVKPDDSKQILDKRLVFPKNKESTGDRGRGVAREYAMTFGVYLYEPVFGHGKIYVAVTRRRNHQNIAVCDAETQHEGMFCQMIENLRKVL